MICRPNASPLPKLYALLTRFRLRTQELLETVYTVLSKPTICRGEAFGRQIIG